MNFTTYKAFRSKFKMYAYYLIVGFVSLVSIVFLPMIGSEVDMKMIFPTNTIGWIIWAVTRGGIAIVNILFFYCFMEQAKVNVSKEDNYIKGCEILQKLSKMKEIKPMSPEKWTAKQYATKGTTLFLSSILSVFALTEAILKFDIVSFLSYIFTIVIGVVFGYLQMRKAEDYWTDEFLQYALMKQEEYKEEPNNGSM